MITKPNNSIKIERQPTQETLTKLGIFTWPIWTKEVSQFPWTYDEAETCYFLEGEVTVTSDDGEIVTVGKGDLVTFPSGMSCTWNITKNVKKHYSFG
jgi:uncharacterized protein